MLFHPICLLSPHVSVMQPVYQFQESHDPNALANVTPHLIELWQITCNSTTCDILSIKCEYDQAITHSQVTNKHMVHKLKGTITI